MPKQALFRLIKRWQQYRPIDDFRKVPRDTRGFYVLYENVRPKSGPVAHADVRYIGVAGLGNKAVGIRSRLRSHKRRKRGWSHFSLFEVHDNVTGEDIRELEALLLQIFRHDSRIGLTNVQKGSRKFHELRKDDQWKG